MDRRERTGVGHWWDRASAPDRFMLVVTAAGLAVSAALLIVGGDLSKGEPDPTTATGDPEKRAANALESIAETLETISGAPTNTRNLSVTVRLDEDQWQGVRDAAAGLRVVVEGMAGKAARIAADAEKAAEEMAEISGKSDDIAAGVEKVAETAGRISTGVEDVVENTGRIERGVRGVAYGTAYVADAMDGISGRMNDLDHEVGLLRDEVDRLPVMPRASACDSPNCLGAVHFPHDWPSESETSSACQSWQGGAEEWITDSPDVAQAITVKLKEVARKLIENEKLKTQKTGGPVYVVGHASTDGDSTYNESLSRRRAEFVKCYLERHPTRGNQIPGNGFKLCSTGEKASTGGLRHPDSWYRVVQVFLGEPPGGVANCADE